MTHENYRVAIVQETIPHYRIPFFADLRKKLAAENVTLALLYGRPTDDAQAAELRLALPWARSVDLHVVNARGASAVYQPVVRMTSGADLVIVEQANRMLANYALLAKQAAGGPRVAFWGHGANLQAGDGSLAKLTEQWKRTYSTRPHWWFAYTEGSAERVHALGFDRSRITVVQNAVDTAWAAGVADVEREPYRCVYVGRLYKEKRLDFLVRAGEEAATRIPKFELVVLGDGPERAHLDELAKDRPWLKVRGTVVGHAKAVELKKASLLLMPGLVGLAVVDSFATETPLVTTDVPFHSPEVEYLVNAVNGVVLPGSTTAAEYGTTVAELLQEERSLRRLRNGCKRAAKKYTLAAMVERFGDGVVDAVKSSRATPPKYVQARHEAWLRTRDVLRRAGTKASRVTTNAFTREHRRDDLVRIGSEYGGWWIPTGLLDKYSICYLAGVGEDTTFDEGLIARFGSEVWAFDPTPRAMLHARRVTSKRFHFMDVGIWSESTTKRFYAPADPDHVSHSIVNIQDTDQYFEARCETVAAAMLRLGHTELDLLKLSVNGAEEAVLEQMLADGVKPRVLCVELDAVDPVWKPLALIRELTQAGYEVNFIEDRRYTLTRTS